MSKETNENQEILKNKLDYIGLNLNRIPKFLTEYEPLNFRILRGYDNNTTYKVYKYIDIQDIQILVTPTDRLTELKERYKLATPIFTYLDQKNEQNIEKFATFLKMLANLKIERIEELENEQKKLKEILPTKIKYQNHYVWQIYYSDYAKKYFMLVPTNEQDASPLFYLLKKQISSRKNKKKEKIFVPISYLEYSGQFLSKSEISDIENYLWYFTKDWVSVYEVYDKNEKMSIKIIGSTDVYEKIKSDYVITLDNKKEAIEFYKLLKAMFILSTAVPNEYKFLAKISQEGKLEFKYKDKLMNYQNLSEFIKLEYLDKIEELKKEIKEKEKLENRLKRFNLLVEELTEDYLARQRQIATFLECKKTFLGRVKYFFKKRKDNVVIKKANIVERDNKIKKYDELENLYEEKEKYTIENLINICTKLNEKRNENTNIILDINAIEVKKDILSKKIDNADLYIKEIDKHKKSIFDFWKFTGKDEVQTLKEGEEIKENKKVKIQKYFDYENDIEDLGKIVDELQRRKLSKNETDAIFATKQVINLVRELDKYKKNKELEENIEIFEEELLRLQEEYKNNIEYINMKDFDIFGSMSDDKTKMKMIRNEKHREIEKDKYKVLNVNLETEVNVFRDNIKYYLGLISEAFNKIKSPYNMSVYKNNDIKEIEGINIFDISQKNLIEKTINNRKDNFIINKLNIKENMPILFYSNIIFYDNFNKTLPIGMDLSSEVLIDLDKTKINCIKEEHFYINYNVNDFEVKTKKIDIFEYEILCK